MRKLKLNIENLAVESFETIQTEGSAGTVLGHETAGIGCVSLPGDPTDSHGELCECYQLVTKTTESLLE